MRRHTLRAVPVPVGARTGAESFGELAAADFAQPRTPRVDVAAMHQHKPPRFGLLLAVTVAAAHHAEAAPDWCNGLEKPMYGGKVSSALTSKDPRDALPDLVGLTCWPDEDAQKRMKEIDGARARWSATMMLTEADWVDVGAWTMSPQSTRSDTDFALDPSKKYAWSALGPLDQFAAIARSSSYSEYTYLADALGPKLSETGRLGYIIQACFRDNVDATVVEWASCNPDLALLDRKKLADEIRNDRSHSGHEKMIVRIQAFFLEAKVKEMSEKWKEAKAKDPVYATMFDIAQKTRKQWDQLWKTEATALDLMLAMDDARATSSRKLREGCEAKVWPAVKAAIGAVEAKRFAGISTDIADSWLAPAMGVVASSPRGWLALAAYHSCESKDDALSATIGHVLAFLPGYRGPRLATQTAIMNAGLQLDDASAKIDVPSIDHRARFEGIGARGYYATVSKVTVKGDKATVAFKPKLEKLESCTNRKPTNRISMITSSGQVIYESTCTSWKPVVVNAAPPAQEVGKRYVDGLKPGMNVVIGGGMVMGVFAAGKNLPSVVAGAVVK